MRLLRDRWRRTAFHQYFEGLEPIDRATWWVFVALAFALAISITKLTNAGVAS